MANNGWDLQVEANNVRSALAKQTGTEPQARELIELIGILQSLLREARYLRKSAADCSFCSAQGRVSSSRPIMALARLHLHGRAEDQTGPHSARKPTCSG